MTTVDPTFASRTSRTTRVSMLPFNRQTRPEGCAGSATAKSSPRAVVIFAVGPAGSGPTGGADAAAEAASTRTTAARPRAWAMRTVNAAPAGRRGFGCFDGQQRPAGEKPSEGP